MLNTPHTVRAHNAAGHIEYLFFVLHTFAMPNASGGWESFQPPFYYFLSVCVLFPFKFLGAAQPYLLSFQFFRPFTYYEPLTNEQMERRSLLRIWNLHFVSCEKPSPLVRRQCTEEQ